MIVTIIFLYFYIFFVLLHVTTLHYQSSSSVYNLMNVRNNEKQSSNEAHLLLWIVVIRKIIKIEMFLFFGYYCYFHFQCFIGTNVNVVSIDK